MHSTLLMSLALLSATTPAQSTTQPPAPAAQTEPTAQTASSVPTPAPIGQVLAARPFILEEPYESDWRAGRPLVGSGWLLVIEADRETARPRQVGMPVLFVGDQVAERLNDGGPAEARSEATTVRLVVVVPGPLGPDGDVIHPLLKHPAFFGSAVLPEQVTNEIAARELEAAMVAGIKPPSTSQLDLAAQRGGPILRAADRASLLVSAASMVRQWSPTEAEQADLLEGRPVTSNPVGEASGASNSEGSRSPNPTRSGG